MAKTVVQRSRYPVGLYVTTMQGIVSALLHRCDNDNSPKPQTGLHRCDNDNNPKPQTGPMQYQISCIDY